MKATAVKEKPILFSSEMIRALLSGRKTMTRRIVKPQPHPNISRFEFLSTCFKPVWSSDGSELDRPDFFVLNKCIQCPYGVPGDRLWVREAWQLGTGDGERMGINVQARTEPWCVEVPAQHREAAVAMAKRIGFGGKWRPSIHMPRWASRITLEITDVRVERLQDISERDAEAEGVGGMRDMRFASTLGNIHSTGHRLNFMDLWNKINGPSSWKSNPFVWALTFKRCEAQP